MRVGVGVGVSVGVGVGVGLGVGLGVEGQRKEANGYANRNLSTYKLRSYVHS